jgi:hypothetical protein
LLTADPIREVYTSNIGQYAKTPTGQAIAQDKFLPVFGTKYTCAHRKNGNEMICTGLRKMIRGQNMKGGKIELCKQLEWH